MFIEDGIGIPDARLRPECGRPRQAPFRAPRSSPFVPLLKEHANGRQPTLDAPPGRLDLGRFRRRRRTRPAQSADPEKVLQGIAEVKVGKTFCLSLPLDYPGGAILSPRRHPPVLKPTMRGDKPNMNYPLRCDDPDRHRHRLRRPGDPDAAILDAVGQPGPCRPDVRRRRRRQRRGRVLQRLSRRPRHHRPRLLRRAGQHDAVRRAARCAASRRAEHGGSLHAGPRRDDRPGGAFRPHRPHRQLRRTDGHHAQGQASSSNPATSCCSAPASPRCCWR